MDKAIIFDIQRNSFVDGPGIRTTIFFKGCNLRCKWCHNPESQSLKPQIMFYADKCTGCGRCRGITAADTDFICFNDAKQICGKEYTVDEVFAEVVKDRSFYENSGGGVTFSGGEYTLGGQPVTVSGIECRLKDGTIAGSILTMDKAVRNFLKHSGLPIYTVVNMASLNAARVIGEDKMRGSVDINKCADLVIADENINIKATIVNGETV